MRFPALEHNELVLIVAALFLCMRVTAAVDQPIVNFQALSLNNTLDVLPDFSFSGYNNSNSGLPAVDRPASRYIQASTWYGDDKTAEIQQAIDAVASEGGGIVELSAGTHYLTSDPINLFAKNVTLRGVLPPNDATAYPTSLVVSGQSRFVFNIGDPDGPSPSFSEKKLSKITEEYVPVGRTYVIVKNAALFEPGQMVTVEKTITQSWIQALGMDKLVRDGRKQTWIADGTPMVQYRTITAVSANTLWFDIPLVDSINATFGADGIVRAYDFKSESKRTKEVGLENFSIAPATYQSGLAITSRDAFEGVAVFNPFVQDAWVRNVNATGFLSSFNIAKGARQITLQDITMVRTASADNSAGYPADIMLQGTTTLILRCTTIGVSGSTAFSVATGSLVSGPNAIVEYTSTRAVHQIQPHQRWATGVLLDNSDIGSAFFVNRGIMGSGQGWSIGNGVLWNVRATGVIRIQSPPYSANLCVGCTAQDDDDDARYPATPKSYMESETSVTPASLFATQLIVRRGTSALQEVLPLVSLPVVKLEDVDLSLNAKVKVKSSKSYTLLSLKKCRVRTTLRKRNSLAQTTFWWALLSTFGYVT